MPAKVDTYLDLARETAQGLAGSVGAWTAFLDTASRLYKYPFHDQLMIHAQRPGATACASYEVWNDTMRRYVRRSAKGIALVDNSGDAPRLRYVFDIADTGTRRSSRPFSPWQIDSGNIEAVSSALEDSFGAERDASLASQLEAAAALLADEYWMGNSRDILGIVDGSSLEEYDDFNKRAAFVLAMTVREKDYDGRFSRENKAWAKTQPLPPDPERRGRYCSYVVDKAHPLLTDALITHARRELERQKKPSVMEKLQNAETPPRTAVKAAVPEL